MLSKVCVASGNLPPAASPSSCHPGPSQVLDIFARVRAAFPHAEVLASTLDAFAGPLVEAAPKLGLDVVTGEVGDTWIHGIASDADKLSEFRAMLRARRAFANKYGDAAFTNFSRLLTKVSPPPAAGQQG